MELFLDQGNYMLQKLSKNAGARIVLHQADQEPMPDEYGIDIQPNTASSIAIQVVSETKQKESFFQGILVTSSVT